MARPNESELIVPLRKAWNITRFKRAPRAMQIIKDHVIQHLKVTENETVYIDNSVNEYIWSRGIENPPRKVRLQVIRVIRMGNIRPSFIKIRAITLVEQHREKFTEDFDHNKKVVSQLTDVNSKKLRNWIAGYVTRYLQRRVD